MVVLPVMDQRFHVADITEISRSARVRSMENVWAIGKWIVCASFFGGGRVSILILTVSIQTVSNVLQSVSKKTTKCIEKTTKCIESTTSCIHPQ